MKQKYQAWQCMFFLLFFNLFSLALLAQENTGSTDETTTSKTSTTTTDVNITSNSSGEWYTQPWIWVVGAAVFILLLVALMRGGSRESVTTSDRVTVKKTIERNDEV